ncbi:MAG: hypothetical protein EDM05_66355 [Leptolyngbya sp. IPPAS B-1204]
MSGASSGPNSIGARTKYRIPGIALSLAEAKVAEAIYLGINAVDYLARVMPCLGLWCL